MAKIIPRLFGGLGNQLFIYACARRLSLMTDSELVLDNLSGFKYDIKYKRKYQLHNFNISSRFASKYELFYPFPKILRFIFRFFNKYYQFDNKRYIIQQGYSFDARMLHLKPNSYLYLEGYWQSEKYFKDIENILRKELVISPPCDDYNLYLRDLIINAPVSVSVHYRFFDSIDKVSNLSSEYYNEAFKLFSQKFPNATYFVFSDLELNNISTSISPDNIIYVNHNKSDDLAYIDLWLMSLCSNFIISNSTFSWWGAWLSSNASKVVIAPNNGFSSNGIKGYDIEYPEDWILI